MFYQIQIAKQLLKMITYYISKPRRFNIHAFMILWLNMDKNNQFDAPRISFQSDCIVLVQNLFYNTYAHFIFINSLKQFSVVFKPFFKIITYGFYFTGHCLGITDYGNLNEDVCDKFVSGCPSNEYNSTDIYKCAYLFNFFLCIF